MPCSGNKTASKQQWAAIEVKTLLENDCVRRTKFIVHCSFSVCMYRKSVFVSFVISQCLIACLFTLIANTASLFRAGFENIDYSCIAYCSILSYASFLQVSKSGVILLTQANISRFGLWLVQVAQGLVRLTPVTPSYYTLMNESVLLRKTRKQRK